VANAKKQNYAKTSLLWHLQNIYRVGYKSMALCFCPCLCQLLTDFQNSFTGTLCRQFAITRLLHIPLHRKCISALLCEISMKYAYNDNDTETFW